MKSTSRQNYRRGARKEYRWMKILKDLMDKEGLVLGESYFLQRSSGSHTPFDVVLWNFHDKEIHAFQIKYYNSRKKVEAEYKSEEFKKFKEFEPIPSLWKHYIVFIKGNKEPIFLWSES